MVAIVDIVLVLVLAYAQWRMPDAVHPTLPFGVRVPADRLSEPVIAGTKRSYRIAIVPVAALAVVASILLGNDATAAGLIPVGFIALMFLDYYAAHRALQKAKEQQRWYEGKREASVASTTARLAPKRYPTGLLLAAIAVVAATAALGILRYPHLPHVLATHFGANGQPNGWQTKTPFSAFSLVWLQVVLTTLFAVMAYFIPRTRQELSPGDPQASVQRHLRFQTAMANVILVLAGLMNITMLLASLTIWGVLPSGVTPLVALLPVLVGVLYTLWVTLRLGQGGSRIPVPAGEQTGYVSRDDDGYWLAGSLYVNRKDPAIFVQRRFGIGWTLNFGHPVSWLVLVGIVVLAALPALLKAHP